MDELLFTEGNGGPAVVESIEKCPAKVSVADKFRHELALDLSVLSRRLGRE